MDRTCCLIKEKELQSSNSNFIEGIKGTIMFQNHWQLFTLIEWEN